MTAVTIIISIKTLRGIKEQQEAQIAAK